VFIQGKTWVGVPHRRLGEFKDIGNSGFRLRNYRQYSWTTSSIIDSYTAFDEG
jgi:hypothetical protein